MDSHHSPAIVAETHPLAQPQALPQETALLAAITAAATNPAVDVDKMERLLKMQEKISADQARRAYVESLHRFQAECPPIHRGRGIVVQQQTRSRYAAYEDVIRTVGPLMQRHGFSASFDTATNPQGIICSVTCTLAHVGGHYEQSTFPVTPDNSGSKNGIQAIGSALSYGKRYALGAILGLVFTDEDDDGRATSAVREAQEAVAPKRRSTGPVQDAEPSAPVDLESVIAAIMDRMESAGVTHEGLTRTLAAMMPKKQISDWTEIGAGGLERLNTEDGWASVMAKMKGGAQ